jgi:ParB/RepB/Spo0J family partition protein
VSSGKGRPGLQRPTKARLDASNDSSTAGHLVAELVARDERAHVVPLRRVKPSANQPRQTFDDESITELAEDIRAHGLINPLTVTVVGDEYRIVAGERRYRALQIAGFTDVSVRVVNEEAARAIQLAENLHREDLPLLEEAQAFASLKEHLQLNVRDLAAKVHRSASYVDRRLQILSWPSDVQDLLRSHPGMLTAAAKIAVIQDPKRRAARIQALIEGDTPAPVSTPTLVGGDSPSAAGKARVNPKPERGRPPTPFRLRERKSGGFDVQIHYRPGKADRADLITQLRSVLARLEEEHEEELEEELW